MDTGNGRFKMLDEFMTKKIIDKRPEERERIFRVGEEVQIKGSRFRITHIKERGDMRLKLLPKEANNG